MSIEADLRSGEREERRIRFLVNGRREKTVIVGVPESIRFGVCNISLFLSSSLIHVKVTLYEKGSKSEFVRFESLKELNGIGLNEREEKREQFSFLDQ